MQDKLPNLTQEELTCKLRNMPLVIQKSEEAVVTAQMELTDAENALAIARAKSIIEHKDEKRPKVLEAYALIDTEAQLKDVREKKRILLVAETTHHLDINGNNALKKIANCNNATPNYSGA